jgi:D-alanyl-D-alanine carboxypeptidase (penicillin-binding protein 5/6)
MVAASAAARGSNDKPQVAASAAILMDAETGEVLYARNPDQRRPIASTTKIMTALLILERGRLDQMCQVSKQAAETPQSSIHLHPGEAVRLGDLLTALLVKSANDAAAASAEAVAGSEQAFAGMMNARAHQLGADNSHFVNPHGLYDPQHYSTARDLATITRHALRLPEFARLVATRQTTIPGPPDGSARVLVSKNKLLSLMPGADGVKTGFVKESGPCLVASASRDGWRLIAVLLDSPALWADAQGLLNYGFDNFRPLVFAQRGKPAVWLKVWGGARPRVPLVARDTLMVVLSRSGAKESLFAPRLELVKSHLTAPVRAGQSVGRMALVAGSRELSSVDLLVGSSVPRSLWANLWFSMSRFTLCLVALAMVMRGYHVASKKHRTRRVYVRLTPAQREPRSSVLPQ